MASHAIGTKDMRPWGNFEVRNLISKDGIEYCEKLITVEPGQVLSLQSHHHREEFWLVQDGYLTAIAGHKRHYLGKTETLHVPLGVIHTMANLSNRPLLVHELQKGVCREDDIVRYCDNYGRSIATDGPPGLIFSLGHYKTILSEAKSFVRI